MGLIYILALPALAGHLHGRFRTEGTVGLCLWTVAVAVIRKSQMSGIYPVTKNGMQELSRGIASPPLGHYSNVHAKEFSKLELNANSEEADLRSNSKSLMLYWHKSILHCLL